MASWRRSDEGPGCLESENRWVRFLLGGGPLKVRTGGGETCVLSDRRRDGCVVVGQPPHGIIPSGPDVGWLLRCVDEPPPDEHS